MACVFMAIFMMRVLNENSDIDAMSNGVDDASPIPQIAVASNTKANVMGMRLSNLDTSQPEIGKPISELIGMNNRMVPSSASL